MKRGFIRFYKNGASLLSASIDVSQRYASARMQKFSQYYIYGYLNAINSFILTFSCVLVNQSHENVSVIMIQFLDSHKGIPQLWKPGFWQIFFFIFLPMFQEDFVLMCKNAMQYNGPDTIYFKHAEKMLAMGIKMLSKVKNFLQQLSNQCKQSVASLRFFSSTNINL